MKFIFVVEVNIWFGITMCWVVLWVSGSHIFLQFCFLINRHSGRNVCLYPNGGDPMMTEPDLVTIGDGASVDDASLIAHINTRGIFRLNPLYVGNGCVLRGEKTQQN